MITILNFLASALLEPDTQTGDELQFIGIVTLVSRQIRSLTKLP